MEVGKGILEGENGVIKMGRRMNDTMMRGGWQRVLKKVKWV